MLMVARVRKPSYRSRVQTIGQAKRGTSSFSLASEADFIAMHMFLENLAKEGEQEHAEIPIKSANRKKKNAKDDRVHCLSNIDSIIFCALSQQNNKMDFIVVVYFTDLISVHSTINYYFPICRTDQSCSKFYGPDKFSPLKLGVCDVGSSSCRCSQGICG